TNFLLVAAADSPAALTSSSTPCSEDGESPASSIGPAACRFRWRRARAGLPTGNWRVQRSRRGLLAKLAYSGTQTEIRTCFRIRTRLLGRSAFPIPENQDNGTTFVGRVI